MLLMILQEFWNLGHGIYEALTQLARNGESGDWSLDEHALLGPVAAGKESPIARVRKERSYLMR